MARPSPSELLGFIASHEPLARTLEHYPGVTREELRALLREAAVLLRLEVQADGPAAEPARTRPLPEPESASVAPPPRPPLEETQPAGRRARLLRLFSDGAARGNPGPAGAGAVLTTTDGTVVARLGKYLGTQTNNYAEYMGLLLGLEEALKLGANEIEVVADSELMVRQLNGLYKVKNAGLKPLFQRAQGLLGLFRRSTVRHVPREQNKLADEMSNRAIDERM
ncbi:MAG TPA: RNase H [Myxococcales bacterium]|nr:RNase H [Myxococcales bacterium]